MGFCQNCLTTRQRLVWTVRMNRLYIGRDSDPEISTSLTRLTYLFSVCSLNAAYTGLVGQQRNISESRTETGEIVVFFYILFDVR